MAENNIIKDSSDLLYGYETDRASSGCSWCEKR